MPLLTVVITGRDDGYMPDFRYRLRTTLEYFARNIALLGCEDEIEVLFVDWGSKVELSRTLPLSDTASGLIKWLYVPQKIVRSALGGENKFHNTIAFNTGLRRSSGQFVAFFPADAILPPHALGSILSLLKGETEAPVPTNQAFFCIPRAHVPWQFVDTQPSVSEWDRYLWFNAWAIPLDPESAPSVFGGAAAFFLHRDLWLDCGGLDEQLGGWGGSDIDLGMRLGFYYPWIDLSVLGVRAYHMEHGPGGSREAAVKAGNRMTYDQSFCVNRDDWGLRDADIEIVFASDQLRITDEGAGKSLPPPSKELVHQKPILSETVLSEEILCAAATNLKKVLRHLCEQPAEFPRELAEIEALLALACYCDIRQPHSFSDIGAQSPFFPCLVSFVVPHATIRCLAPDPPEQMYAYAAYLHFRMQHAGYVHCMIGDPASTVSQAFAVMPYSEHCDSAVVPCSLPPDVFDAVIETLLGRLDKTGFILVRADSKNSFDQHWLRLQRRFASKRFVQFGRSGCVGVIDGAGPCDNKNETDKPFWNRRFEATAREILKEIRRYRFIKKAESRFNRLLDQLGWTLGTG